eukprot:3484808-Lingulodinium_polyedra.AAC.1
MAKQRRKHRAAKIRAEANANAKGTGLRKLANEWECNEVRTTDRQLWQQELERFAAAKFSKPENAATHDAVLRDLETQAMNQRKDDYPLPDLTLAV